MFASRVRLVVRALAELHGPSGSYQNLCFGLPLNLCEQPVILLRPNQDALKSNKKTWTRQALLQVMVLVGMV